MKYYATKICEKGTIAVDDTLLVKDAVATAGSRILDGFKPLFSAEAVVRLEEKGYAVSGKAHTGEFGLDLVGEFSYYAPQEEKLEGAAAALYTLTGNTLVVTNGSNGAYYYDADGLHHVAGAACPQVVDTIGAGDSHCGGTIAGLSMGLTMEEAIAKANLAAAAVVGTKGALLSDEDFSKLF